MTSFHVPVSVVVCAYNTGPQIRRTLDAILAQTHRDLELFVIDDASSDDTPTTVSQIKDSRLRLEVNQKNLGVVLSRNKGLELAQGDFIATCDHDDVWRPEKLDAQLAYMDREPNCGVVGTGWLVHARDNKPISHSSLSTDPKYLKWLMFQKNSLLHSSLLMRASLIKKHQIRYDPDLRFADDWKLVWDIAKVGDLGIVNEPLVDYYLHGDNWSLQCTGEMHENGCKNMQMLLSDTLGRFVDEAEARVFFDRVVLGRPSSSDAELLRLGRTITEIFRSFCPETGKKSGGSDQIIFENFVVLWLRLVRCYAAAAGPAKLQLYEALPGFALPSVGVAHRCLNYLKATYRYMNVRKGDI